AMCPRSVSAGTLNAEAENLQQALLALGRDDEPARIARPLDPAEIETARGKRGADSAAEVRTPLGPVEAGAAEEAAACPRLRKIDAELAQERGARFGDRAALGSEQDVPARAELLGQPDAELSGQVIVAGAGAPERLFAARPRPVPWRASHCDIHDGFQ